MKSLLILKVEHGTTLRSQLSSSKFLCSSETNYQQACQYDLTLSPINGLYSFMALMSERWELMVK